MEARLLGSAGWMPTDSRETCCLYVREGDHVLLVDAGTGLRRLVTEPSLLDGVRRLSIVLTHFHLDHVMGLAFVPALERVPVRELWGAGRALSGQPMVELAHRLLDPPFVLQKPEGLARHLDVRELEPPCVEIGAFAVEARVQPRHGMPTLAFRINGDVCYCTDTALDEENERFARGARVLFHEAFGAGDGHTSPGEAARLARAAGVGRLVLIHLNPLVDEDKLLADARRHFDATELGRDGPVALT
jgi:ribonuclease BN (tRNA processing enzyme)